MKMWLNYLIIFIPFLVAILSAGILIPRILVVAYRKRLFDPIDERKLHKRIVPRLGGVAFAPIQCCLLILSTVIIYKGDFIQLNINGDVIFPMFVMLMCGLFTLFIIGIGDDLIGVNYRWKFLVQIMVASLFPIADLWINDLYGVGFLVSLPAWVGMPLTVFVVVLVVNAINLMDGLDGLCAGIIATGTLFLGVLFFLSQAWLHALFAFITTGVLVPFFYYNVVGASKRKRQIFMGDTGSTVLGYSIAFLTVSFAMNNNNIKSFSEGAIVTACSTLIVPVFDVARVMWVRWRNKRPVFKPDRSHLHHKFLRVGMSHRQAMLAVLALVLFYCVFNVLLVQVLSNNLVLVADVLLWIGFHYSFDLCFIRSRSLHGEADVTEIRSIVHKKGHLVKES